MLYCRYLFLAFYIIAINSFFFLKGSTELNSVLRKCILSGGPRQTLELGFFRSFFSIISYRWPWLAALHFFPLSTRSIFLFELLSRFDFSSFQSPLISYPTTHFHYLYHGHAQSAFRFYLFPDGLTSGRTVTWVRQPALNFDFSATSPGRFATAVEDCVPHIQLQKLERKKRKS